MMNEFKIKFFPQNINIAVSKGITLLEAASKANIIINNLCGGDGICGRCKMIILEGNISGGISDKLTRGEIQKGYVLACMTYIESDLTVEIPKETLVQEKTANNEDTKRFIDLKSQTYKKQYKISPLTRKVVITLEKPSLTNNAAIQQRICEEVRRKLNRNSTQMGLKIIKSLPKILQDSNNQATATIGFRKNITEVMDIESGDTINNYIAACDMGTTTIVVHLVDAVSVKTIDARACFNSQGIYGREVTQRMINAEKKGTDELQKLLIKDINDLIYNIANDNNLNLKDITAVVCSGNTAMSHFLLGLPTESIRRNPYVPISVEPPPIRAAEVGIRINPRGLLYSLPGISGWVGSDITAGILATGINRKEEISLLMDIGTNGEIVVGNIEWLVSCSASAGPALEGASIECGMRAESGAIENIYIENNEIYYKTIGNKPAKGICGSGIIDLVSVLLQKGIINRTGKFIIENSKFDTTNGIKKFILVDKNKAHNNSPIFITESDIENIITAKAAIFAAMKILITRLSLSFSDIHNFFIAGAFGNYLDIKNSISIGLLPNISIEKIKFVGNTSIQGAKEAALHQEAFDELYKIRENTTYYDLMGADDYVDEFKKAMFLPHTDIEDFEVKIL